MTLDEQYELILGYLAVIKKDEPPPPPALPSQINQPEPADPPAITPPRSVGRKKRRPKSPEPPPEPTPPPRPRDPAADASRNEIALQNRGLVWFVVKRMRRRLWRAGVPEDDAVQAGWVALLRAVELWRPDGGAKLSTYAVKAIRRAIFREMDRARLVSIPPPGETDHLRAWKEQAQNIIYLRRRDIGLNNHRPRGWNDIADPAWQPDPPGDIGSLRGILQRLTNRDRAIAWDRASGLTYEECAKKHGLSKERIRQLDLRIIRRLRHFWTITFTAPDTERPAS